MKISEIKEKLEKISFKIDDNEDITYKEKKKLSYLLSNSNSLKKINSFIQNKDSYVSVIDICSISDELENLSKELTDLKSDIEVEHFLKSGNVIDEDELKKLYVKRKIKDNFPNFNLKRHIEIIKNPFYEIESDDGFIVKYDKVYVKKMCIALNQMIFNEMDIKIINAGNEGTGKSLWSSQQMLFIYKFLTEIGVIDYKFDVEKLLFSSIESYIEDKDLQRQGEQFRLRCLDEAYDLNRQNFREQTNKIFKNEMRTGRKNLNIDILNLPQVGELEVAITLSRTNFIFICKMENDIKTMTLKKGIVEMYIIPRTNKIYSYVQKRNISAKEIKQTLAKLLEKKENYYLEMPKELLIHRFTFSETWGFNPKKYKTHVLKQNKEKRLSGEIYLSEYEQYIIFKKLPETKHFGTFDIKNPKDKRMYDVFQKKIKLIKNKFINNLELLHKYEIMYGNSEEVLNKLDTKTIIEEVKENIEFEAATMQNDRELKEDLKRRRIK